MTKKLVKSRKLVGKSKRHKKRAPKGSKEHIHMDKSARYFLRFDGEQKEIYREIGGGFYLYDWDTDTYQPVSSDMFHAITIAPYDDIKTMWEAQERGNEATEPYLTGVHWDETASESYREDLMELKLRDKFGREAEILYREEPEFIEVYSIEARPKGQRLGTHLMNRIFAYARSKDKGVIATKVKNEPFVEKLGMKKRNPVIVDGERLEELTGYAEYVYGDVPKDAIDYSWIHKGGD